MNKEGNYFAHCVLLLFILFAVRVAVKIAGPRSALQVLGAQLVLPDSVEL
jgi:hypothetical protein